jgi:cell division protein FtsB
MITTIVVAPIIAAIVVVSLSSVHHAKLQYRLTQQQEEIQELRNEIQELRDDLPNPFEDLLKHRERERLDALSAESAYDM